MMERNTTKADLPGEVRGETDTQDWKSRRYPVYIGLDVHKDTIAVSAADGTLSSES